MRILTKEEIDAYNQGIRDAKAGLPCDASSTRVTANYFGKFVNDYYGTRQRYTAKRLQGSSYKLDTPRMILPW
jgi:hypothetical protein